MIPKAHFAMLLICLTLLIITGGTCDQTRLTGEILVRETGIRVGDTVPLQLVVPENLSGIYRVEWEVEPETSGAIFFGTQLLESLTDEELALYFGTSKGINADRIALFLPKEKGTSTIFATGFYKQTNPQPITTIDLEIID